MPISDVTNEDCMLGMSRYPAKFFDLAVVDPQTGQGEGKKHLTRGKSVLQRNGSRLSLTTSHRVKDWDEAPPTQEYYDELFRVSKHQIIMCENYLHFSQKNTSCRTHCVEPIAG
jgi:site-specific DNA-methyltransferase (adenine-specific)